MVREISKSDYSEEEIENLKLGKCWCGKPKSEFDSIMRVYCSKQHQKEWYARTINWSIYKDDILEKNGKKCVECGVTPDATQERFEIAMQEWKTKIKNLPDMKRLIDQLRVKKLNELEEKYQQIMDDDYLLEHDVYYDIRDEIGEKPNEYRFEVRFDVDHKLAVALGGDMWDAENLQVLCTDCHKEKTKLDMKKIKAKRRKLIPFSTN